MRESGTGEKGDTVTGPKKPQGEGNKQRPFLDSYSVKVGLAIHSRKEADDARQKDGTQLVGQQAVTAGGEQRQKLERAEKVNLLLGRQSVITFNTTQDADRRA